MFNYAIVVVVTFMSIPKDFCEFFSGKENRKFISKHKSMVKKRNQAERKQNIK